MNGLYYIMSDFSLFDQIDQYVLERNPNVRNARIGEIVYGNKGIILQATALGSCVAVILYDDVKKIAGLAHIALPLSSEKLQKIDKEEKPGKFADLALPALMRKIRTMGGKRLKAKIAGGSKVINMRESEMHIGLRNANTIRDILAKKDIDIIVDDTGGEISRSVSFNINTSKMEVRIVRKSASLQDFAFETYTL